MTARKKQQSYEDKIRTIVEQEAIKQIDDAPRMVKQVIQDSLLALLGISRNYHHGYEIDHCNNRNSVLIDAFRNCAISEAERIARGYKPTKEQIANYEAAFAKEFSSQMSRAVQEAARERARTEAAALVANIKVDVAAALGDKL